MIKRFNNGDKYEGEVSANGDFEGYGEEKIKSKKQTQSLLFYLKSFN